MISEDGGMSKIPITKGLTSFVKQLTNCFFLKSNEEPLPGFKQLIDFYSERLV